jgi:Cu+-exporting ATPase
VIETLARANAVVFDKTGTLTAAGAGAIAFHGSPLTAAEERWVYSMTRHTTHPYAIRIGEAIVHGQGQEPVRSFRETAGCGMEGTVAGNEIWMGSATWLESRGVRSAALAPSECRAPVATGSVVHVAINQKYRGRYVLTGALRPQTRQLIANLSAHYELALLSGDNERERERFSGLFSPSAHLHFNQSPLNKLGLIRQLQESGKTVMMVGDGLNDAGALKQSDVGVAVVENISAFSPASDAIMAADRLPQLHEVLRFSKATVRIVQLSFLISSVYNVVGIAIAASGLLSPVICAILMPLSSVTVVAFACGATSLLGQRIGWAKPAADQASNGAVSPQLAAKKLNPSCPVFATQEMQP